MDTITVKVLDLYPHDKILENNNISTVIIVSWTRSTDPRGIAALTLEGPTGIKTLLLDPDITFEKIIEK